MKIFDTKYRMEEDMATGFCKKLLENFVGKTANELVDAVTLSIKQMSN